MPDKIVWNASAARHLLSRIAFASTPLEAARLAALPPERAVKALLDNAAKAPPPAKPDWVKEPWVNDERVWADTTREARAENHRVTRRRYNDEVNQLRSWWLKEMMTSATPLREVMTLFWHGHFTTAQSKMGVSQAQYQQNALLRAHALGNFRTLLEAATLDAAMLMYLDLEDSDKGNPNENFARELLELFTLGVGHYTEKDVKEIARALSGWTLDAAEGAKTSKGHTPPADTPRAFTRDGLTAKFLPEKHDDGTKTLFGSWGKFGVQEVLDLIVKQEACAKFLAGRLIAFFGTADPEGMLRGRMAEAFQTSHYEVRPMLEVLLTSPEFYAPASHGRQIKGPVQLLVGACRQLELDVKPTPLLAQLTAAMGQELFNPPNVKGWPGGEMWIGTGTLAVRYHLPDTLFDGKEPAGLEPLGTERFIPLPADEAARRDLMKRLQAAAAERKAQKRKDGVKVKFVAERLFPEGVPNKVEAVVDVLMERLLVVTPRGDTRAALIEAASKVPVAERPALVARLLLTTPEYQLA